MDNTTTSTVDPPAVTEESDRELAEQLVERARSGSRGWRGRLVVLLLLGVLLFFLLRPAVCLSAGDAIRNRRRSSCDDGDAGDTSKKSRHEESSLKVSTIGCLERRQDGVLGDVSRSDELCPSPTSRLRERCCPTVLEDQDPGR